MMHVQVGASHPLASSLAKSQAYFRQIRWHGHRRCPRCHYPKLHQLRRQRFRCGGCRYEFGEFTGTYLGQLRVSLDLVAHLLSLFTRGVPAYQVRWHVPVSLATVERAFRLFRQAIYDAAMEELSQLRSSGELGLDETAFGNHRRGKGSWGAVGKVLIFGISQRDGHVVTFPVSNRRRTPVRPIAHHSQRGSIASADDLPGYVTLTLWGKHQRVTHKRGQFFHGRSHINDIESFWSCVRMWLTHYRGVPRQYFPLYLKEIEWRFNHRNEDLFSLLATLVTRSVATV